MGAQATPKHSEYTQNFAWHRVFVRAAVIKCDGMSVSVRSFAKINLGLCIGASRPDGFHDLRTVYQIVGLHDIIRVSVAKARGLRFGRRILAFLRMIPILAGGLWIGLWRRWGRAGG